MHRILATVSAFALTAAPGAAGAGLACYPLDKIEAALGSDYGETRRFAGRESEGIEYRLYVNAETGSWSWVGIPAGSQIGCLIFAGKSRTDAPSTAKPSPPNFF